MPLAKRILQEATIFLLIKDYSAFSVFSSSADASAGVSLDTFTVHLQKLAAADMAYDSSVFTILIRTYRTIGKQHIETEHPSDDRNTANEYQPTGLVQVMQPLHALRQREPYRGYSRYDTNQDTKQGTTCGTGSRTKKQSS